LGGAEVVTVGVAKLKASLSSYLSRVKAGEVVVVTEHGRPIAHLVPAPTVATDAQRHLARLERSGLLRRGSGMILESVAGLPRAVDASGASLAALLAEREDGR
jgi:prevent-host-death family protein